MKIYTTILLLFYFTTVYAQNNIKITNNTNQIITNLEYWIGSENESLSPNLIFKGRGTVDTTKTNSSNIHKIPEKFKRKKKNTIIVKATLAGGGYLKQKYSIAQKEIEAPINLINIAKPVPNDDYNKVIEDFRKLKLDKSLKIDQNTGLDAVIGAMYIYDSTEKILLYKITPKDLKSKVTKITNVNNTDKVSGIFSSKTTGTGGVNLPFVSLNTAFEHGDVAKFQWEIEDVGEYIWSSSNGKDLATLFNELSDDTKKVLIKLYSDNKGAKLKFIDRAFVIGRIEVSTERTQVVNVNTEINASSFVTAKGNYVFNDLLEEHHVESNIITEIDGYYATSLLSNLYLLDQSQKKTIITKEEEERIKSEYEYLMKLYPDMLAETADVNIMRKAIKELNEKQGGISFLATAKQNDGKAKVDLTEINNNEKIGDVIETKSGDNDELENKTKPATPIENIIF